MKLKSSISLPAGVTSILLQRENGLIATTCDDLTIRIVDIETQRVVRQLTGFRGNILDAVCAFLPLPAFMKILISSAFDNLGFLS